MDNNGRILLPPPLREFANLDKRIALTGQGNKLVIWAESTWITERDSWVSDNNSDEALSAELESLSL